MPADRLQGVALAAGGGLLLLLTGPGDLEFHWVPLLLGLSYLAAAALGGRRGSYWPTALVLVAFGAGVLAVFEWGWEVREAGAFLLAAGAGALATEAARRSGFAISSGGAAATVLAIGAFVALERDVEALRDATTYGIALVVVGGLRAVSGRRVDPA